jgi:hypothetical protein
VRYCRPCAFSVTNSKFSRQTKKRVVFKNSKRDGNGDWDNWSGNSMQDWWAVEASRSTPHDATFHVTLKITKLQNYAWRGPEYGIR